MVNLLSLEVSGDRIEDEDSRRSIPIIVSWKAIGCRMFRKCRPYLFSGRLGAEHKLLNSENQLLPLTFNISLPGRGKAQKADRMCSCQH